jgi:hypothetical protein
MLKPAAFLLVSFVVPVLALLAPAPGHSMGSAPVAALQVGLIRQGLYEGPVDGLTGPATRRALRGLGRHFVRTNPFDARRRLRTALGRWGKHELGARSLHVGYSGWDVAELQFLLAWHGFPSGLFDGAFEQHVEKALVRFQRSVHLPVDGVAGRQTIVSLESTRLPRCPISLAWPVRAPMTSPFGPRGFGFHSGIDLGASANTPVKAAADGKVVWASYMAGGWGNLVILVHGRGVQSMYAHLASIDVHVGEPVAKGEEIGRVGATGDAAGPHLHFEVRVWGAAVNPLPALK